MAFEMHDECGIFGIILEHPAPCIIQYLYNGLFALQHRGQESVGIAFTNAKRIEIYKKQGLVANRLFKIASEEYKSLAGIGHVRYSTHGASILSNIQPIKVNCNKGEIAIAHNGNIPFAGQIIRELIRSGSIFQTTCDSEIFLQLMARVPGIDFEKSLTSVLNQVVGAYSILLLHRNRIIAIRDPHGFRPLSIGKVKKGYVFASESCAFELKSKVGEIISIQGTLPSIMAMLIAFNF